MTKLWLLARLERGVRTGAWGAAVAALLALLASDRSGVGGPWPFTRFADAPIYLLKLPPPWGKQAVLSPAFNFLFHVVSLNIEGARFNNHKDKSCEFCLFVYCVYSLIMRHI